MKKVTLGIIFISVIMFFVALATDIFWLARLFGTEFPSKFSVDPKFYNAFAVPDILLSVFLYVGAVGLLKLKQFGLMSSLVALGMWIFDTLLVFSITKTSQLDIIIPTLIFSFFALVYLWNKRNLFD